MLVTDYDESRCHEALSWVPAPPTLADTLLYFAANQPFDCNQITSIAPRPSLHTHLPPLSQFLIHLLPPRCAPNTALPPASPLPASMPPTPRLLPRSARPTRYPCVHCIPCFGSVLIILQDHARHERRRPSIRGIRSPSFPHPSPNFHTLNPFLFLVFDAAFAAGCHYMDMGMSLSTAHPTDPFHLPGVKLGDAQVRPPHTHTQE
jgi:hypothetical protein